MKVVESSVYSKWFGGLRLHFGPGYRIYFTERNGVLFVVLAGGAKNTQRADIALAKEIAKAI